jgi:hypothetical protein
VERPICAYPTVARYDGKGPLTSAASFACAAPGQAAHDPPRPHPPRSADRRRIGHHRRGFAGHGGIRQRAKALIRPGEVWLDMAGKPIQAHGASILQVGDTFYWYGENKERTLPGSGIWHWGVRAYASKDLVNWADLGLIVPPAPDDPTSPLHPAKQLDRPHILYNAGRANSSAGSRSWKPTGARPAPF